jgi:hypothetical protein
MFMTRRRAICTAFAALASAVPAFGQDGAVRLAEEIKPGDCFRYDIGLSVTGKMKVDPAGKEDSLRLTAKARHQFVERVEVAAENGVGMTLRHYGNAAYESVVGADQTRRSLAADRRLIVAQRGVDGTLHYCPDGPLTRDELDLVAEHFDTLCLPGLLPNRDVKPGESWQIADDAVQAACLFHGLVKHDLAGRLLEVKDGSAIFAIEGTAEGVEHGAIVRVGIQARGKFDLTTKHLTALTWEQADERGSGPVNPPLEVKATVTVSRTPLTEEPGELDESTRKKVPADGKVPPSLLHLRYVDPAGRLQFDYTRDWFFVVQSQTHLVLRLVTNGEFIAQVTMTEWKKPQPGADFTAAVREFKEATTKQPGWEAGKLLEEGLVPSPPGRRIYRLAMAGKQDGVPVFQAFHLIAGPNGEHWAATTLARAETAEKIGTRDAELVTAVVFPNRK